LKKKYKNVFFFGIRHGECDKNKDTNKYETDNVVLNQNGQEQMQQCASLLQYTVIHPPCSYRIYTSPIPRVVESATLLLGHLQRCKEWENGQICIDQRLSNKQFEFENSLKWVLRDMKKDAENEHICLIVTHGRVLKMLNSICKYGSIMLSYTQTLDDLDHGKVFTFLYSPRNIAASQKSTVLSLGPPNCNTSSPHTIRHLNAQLSNSLG